MYRRPRPPLKLIADSGKREEGGRRNEEQGRVYTCELCCLYEKHRLQRYRLHG